MSGSAQGKRRIVGLIGVCIALTLSGLLSDRASWAQEQTKSQNNSSEESEAMRRMMEARLRSQPSDQNPSAEGAPTSVVPPMALKLTGNPVTIETLSSGQLVITGTEADLKNIEALFELIDREPPAKETFIHTLKNASAEQVAQRLETIITEVWPGSADLPEQRVAVIAVAANRLLIAAPAERVDRLLEIIDAIDEASDPIPTVVPLKFFIKNRRAQEVADQLQPILDKLQSRQQAAPEEQIKLEVNDADNSLIVFGPESLRQRIQPLIDQIDVEPTGAFSQVKLFVFPLINATAKDMSDVLGEMLSTEAGKEAMQETIRRLSIVRRQPDGSMKELPPLALDRPLRILADETTNSIIVATVDENAEPLGEIIEMLDGVPLGHEMNMKIFPLKFADAATVRDTLKTMFDEGKRLPERAPGGVKTEAVPEGVTGQALVYNVSLAVDERTNTLIVSGRPEQLAVAQLVVTQLDAPVASVKFPFKMIFMGEFVDASRVAAVVRDLFDKRSELLTDTNAGALTIAREKIYVSVDQRSNALIVSATEENLNEIEQIATQFNVSSDHLVDGVRIITCEQTNAADLKTKIEELWQRKGQLRTQSNLPEDLPILVSDQRSNSLLVSSSPEDFEEIQRLVRRIESQPLSPIAEIRLISLEHNDASQAAEMLSQLFEERMQQRLASGQEPNPMDRVATAVDAATNTLLVACSRENYDEMARIIKAIDVEPVVEGVMRVFTVIHADATSVADKIKELFDQGIYDRQTAADSPLVEAQRRVAIVADARSNSIIASASTTNLTLIDNLIQQMDTTFGGNLAEDTKVIAVKFGDSVKIADMVQKIYDQRKSEAPEPDLFRTPAIIADERSNSVIVSGTRDALRGCEELVAELDQPSGPPSATFEVYALKYGSATKLAAKMQDLFDKRAEGRDETATPINIQADETSNSLVASASQDDHQLIRGLLDLLDKPSTIARQFQIFPLQKARAERVADTLDQLFQQQQGDGGSGRADAIAVQPDARSNSLVVWASASEMDNIGSIIERLDTTRPAVEMMMKVIRLKQALAEDFAQILGDTLAGGQGQGQGQDGNAVILTFEETQPDGSTQLRKLLRQDITITPDPRTNSLMVMAPADSMEMLEAMIHDFDRIEPVTAELALFPLVNADADEIVQKLEEIFGTGNGGTTAGEDRAVRLEGAAGAAGPGEGGVRQPLRFTAVRRTNTVIASGNAVDLKMVERLILELDGQEGEERIQDVYKPRNVPAPDLATALTSFSDAENELLAGLEDEVSVQKRAERQVTVVSDEGSNSMLIGASGKNYPKYMELLQQIDRPEPQVNISVLIAEVSMDDRMEFGVEFAVQDLLFSEHATVNPNGITTGSNFDVVAGTDIGAAGVGFGGLTLTVSGEDFSFLFRALQSQGELEILSRPTILVQNNATGNITIGDRVPIVTGSSSAGGQTSASVQYEDVGIILDVTPHINPDGYVNLEINPEISQISNQSLQVSEGLSAVVISQRSAETTVTVKDGETVILGGLITENTDKSEVKVPVLGDLPLIGRLFKSTNNISRKTELLIVLTVNVLSNEQELRDNSFEELDRTGRFPERIKRSPLMQGLRIRPEQRAFGPDKGSPESAPIPVEPGGADQNRKYGPSIQPYGPVRPSGGAPVASRTAGKPIYGPSVARSIDP